MKTNTIIQGNALQELKKLPKKSINMCMTSPPYWALRDYGTDVETIFDGDKNCEHDFAIVENKNPADRGGHSQFDEEGMGATIGVKNTTKNIKSGFCNKCQAWKGQLGLEPTFDLYIKHLCDIFDEVKRVLRDDGTCWVNLGDTYAGSGQGHKEEHFWNEDGTPKNKFAYKRGAGLGAGIPKVKDWKLNNIPDKCLVMIPFRFAIEMVNRGWILRNTIIWHKRNCMPSSVKDRFTVDFEYLFFFSKKKKYYFETIYEPIAESSFKDNRKDKGLVPHKSGKSYDPQLIQKKESLFVENVNNQFLQLGQPDSINSEPLSSYPQELHSQTSSSGLNSDSILFQKKEPKEVYKSLPKQDRLGKATYTGFNKRYKDRYAIMGTSINSQGRNKRCVWTINPKPFKESHFAVYPEELCETPIRAGTPYKVCPKCKKGLTKEEFENAKIL